MAVEKRVSSTCSVFDCETCSHYKKERCPGCLEGNKVRKDDGFGPCGIHRCATSRGLTSCSECDGEGCPYPRSLEMACPVRGHFEKKRCYSRKLAAHFEDVQTTRSRGLGKPRVPEKTVGRLRRYLHALDEYIDVGVARVSSEDIARKIGVKDYLIRSDFSQFGEFGRPSIGYDVHALRAQLQSVLHLDVPKDMVWIGAVHLAAEPSLLQRLEKNSFRIVAVFDHDPSKFADGIGDLPVLPVEQVVRYVAERGIGGAILAVSAEDAQPIADSLVVAGIKGILNLSSTIIATPPTVCIRHPDILGELYALSYYCHEAHSE